MARLITFTTPIKPSSAPQILEEMKKLGYCKEVNKLRLVQVHDTLDLSGSDLPQQVQDILAANVLRFERDDILVLPGHPLYASLLVAEFWRQTGVLPVTLRRVQRKNVRGMKVLLATLMDYDKQVEIPFENPVLLRDGRLEDYHA